MLIPLPPFRLLTALLSSKTSLLFTFGMLAFLLLPPPAHATRYECVTNQIVTWKDGELISTKRSSTSTTKNNITRFDDVTGGLWIGTGWTGLHFNVLQELHPENPLVATIEVTNGEQTFYQALVIKHAQQGGKLYFMFTSNGGADVGECKVSNP